MDFSIIVLPVILTLWPYLFELSTEGYRTIVLKRRDKHFLTAIIRCVWILAAGFGNPNVDFWAQGSLLAFSFHWLFFSPSFNHWILRKKPDYFGNNVLDRAEKWIVDRVSLMGWLGFKLMLLVSSVVYYIHLNPFAW